MNTTSRLDLDNFPRSAVPPSLPVYSRHAPSFQDTSWPSHTAHQEHQALLQLSDTRRISPGWLQRKESTACISGGLRLRRLAQIPAGEDERRVHGAGAQDALLRPAPDGHFHLRHEEDPGLRRPGAPEAGGAGRGGGGLP